MIPTASPIEVVQFVSALIGTAFNLWGLVLAYEDRAWLRKRGYNGPREFWSTSRVEQEWMLLAAQAVFIVVGLASINLPPPGDNVDMSDQAGIVRIGIVIVTIILANFALKVRHDRAKLANWPNDPRKSK